MNRTLTIAALLLASAHAVFACDPNHDDAPEADERGQWDPGKADDAATCAGSCGGPAPAGCWCDEQCAEFGDCCPDIGTVCGDTCPEVAPPSIDFCPNGMVAPREEDGCVTGFACIECPQLQPPAPGFCEEGQVAAEIDEESGCTSGFDCVDCPVLIPPAPGFCQGGTIVGVVAPDGCLVGFACG